ncbi:MAG: hypothetical protein ACKOOL_05790 [Novosphingobium sp.]
MSLLALSGLAWAVPLHAGGDHPRESYCSWIIKTEDGKFRTEMKLGWNLQLAESDPASMNLPQDVAGITCLRDPPILIAGDVAVLKQGRSLHFGTQDQGMTIVKYELTDGKITYTIPVGGLGSKNLKKVEQALKALQIQ